MVVEPETKPMSANRKRSFWHEPLGLGVLPDEIVRELEFETQGRRESRKWLTIYLCPAAVGSLCGGFFI